MTNDIPDTTEIWWIRVRNVLDRWFVPIVVGLIAVGLLAGGIAVHAHSNPPTETEENVVSTWEESTDLSHQASIQRSNPVFETNETIENRDTYFTRLSPDLEVTHEYLFRAADDETLDVELDVMLRIRSTDAEDRVFWETTEHIDERRYENLGPDERAEISAEVNVTEAAAELERIRGEIGSDVGTAEIAIVFTTDVVGSIDGASAEETHETLLVIEPGDSTYSVEPIGTGRESHRSTEIVEVEKSPDPVRLYGALFLALGSVLGAVGLSAYRRRGRLTPSPAELSAFERHDQRSEFDDWISRAHVPESVLDGCRIELDSLEGLVDVAIDTNRRVIEDLSGRGFVVPGDEFYYVYEFEPLPQESARTIGSAAASATEADVEASTGSNLEGEISGGVSSESSGETVVDEATADGPDDSTRTSVEMTDGGDSKNRSSESGTDRTDHESDG